MNGVELPDYSIYLQIFSFVAGTLLVAAYRPMKRKIKEFIAKRFINTPKRSNKSFSEATDELLEAMKDDLKNMQSMKMKMKAQKCGWSILTGKPTWECHCPTIRNCQPPDGNDAATQRLREGMTDAPVHPKPNRRAAIEHSKKK